MSFEIPVIVAAALIALATPAVMYLLYAFVRGFVIEFRRLHRPQSRPRTPDEQRDDY